MENKRNWTKIISQMRFHPAQPTQSTLIASHHVKSQNHRIIDISLQVRLQTQSSTNPIYSGAADCVKQTVGKEGVRALYKGKRQMC